MEASARHESGELALSSEQFPRSNSYDPKWILDNQMSLSPLWLTEWVCEIMPPAPGMRLLDLGCGRGLSSVSLVQEYDVQVWAVDLWIRPTENYGRFRQSGVQDRAFPICADARTYCRMAGSCGCNGNKPAPELKARILL